jgi:hypothetical protein
MGKKDQINAFWVYCSVAFALCAAVAFRSILLGVIIAVVVLAVLAKGRHVR